MQTRKIAPSLPAMPSPLAAQAGHARSLQPGAGPHGWRIPGPGEILRWALPHLSLSDRLLLKALALVAGRRILAVHGLNHIQTNGDPFILAANHGTRREALLVPALLLLARGGRRVHFLADWSFRLIPGIGLIYSRAQVVTVLGKSARPRCLNAIKPLYAGPLRPFEQARAHLLAGRSIGIFPEGTVNLDPARLLRGRRGAARLSLETGAPVVPMGIRFPTVPPGQPIPAHAPMELSIGAPLAPPGLLPGLSSIPSSGTPPRPPQGRAPRAAVTDWHAAIMTAIAQHSGKTWQGAAEEAVP
jgi:1-acyl-sn-glycerol-3-phosphate acyltransferase